MYASFLGFLLINKALAGLPSKLVEELIVNGVIYVGWNAIKITYQGLTYTIYSAYNYSTNTPLINNSVPSSIPITQIPIIKHIPEVKTDDSWMDDFIDVSDEIM